MEHESLQINNLNFESLSLSSIPPLFLWIVFFVSVLIFIILVVIFRYHWKKFTLDGDISKKAKVLYYGGSAVLLLVMALSAFVYQLSFT